MASFRCSFNRVLQLIKLKEITMATSKIYKKLLDIQSELHAPKGQFNNFGKYAYRSCEDIIEAVKPLLKAHKTLMTISDRMVEVGNRVYVEATAKLTCIETGECLIVTASAREAETKKGMDDSQITGSTSSYARKYALNGLYAIDDTKDADSMDNSHVEAVKKVFPGAKVVEEITVASLCKAIAEASTKAERQKVWKKDSEAAKKLCSEDELKDLKVVYDKSIK